MIIIITFIMSPAFISAFNQKITDFSKLHQVTGVIENVTYYNNSIEINLKGDPVDYIINFRLTRLIDKDSFERNVKKEMQVTLLCEKTNSNQKDVFYLKVGGNIVISQEFTIQAEKEIIRTTKIIASYFFMVSIIYIISNIILIIYYKNQRKYEIYNLDYTEEELSELNNNQSYNSNIRLRSKPTKFMIVLTALVLIIGSFIFVMSLFLDKESMFSAMSSAFIFLFIGGLALLFIYKNYIILDNDILLLSNLFRKKEVHIRDISL